MAPQPHFECHRYVDMWAMPGMHPSNIEFFQRLKSGDTNHFTKGMDVIGTISELDPDDRWERTHLIGVRTDVWKPDNKEKQATLRLMKQRRQKELKQNIKRKGKLNQKQEAILEEQSKTDAILNMEIGDIQSRRLILKLFKTNTTRVRWCGTIEQVTATEVHNSIGSRRPLLTFVVTLPGSQLVTYIQENHQTFRVPAVFTFCYFEKGQAYHVVLKRRWVSLGPDFDVTINGEPVGIVDGKLLCFGSDSYIDLDGHELANDTQFIDLITLFTSTIGYHKAMRKSLKRRVKSTLAGETHAHLIEDEEIRLRHNGRAAA